MTGLVRKATFLSACGMLIAGTAMAFVPSPVTSIIPCGIRLVGRTSASGSDHVRGDFTIVVKDIAGNPIPNAAIVIDFTNCCNDLRPSVNQHDGGGVLEANHKKIDVTANGAGSATICIQGVADNLLATPGSGGCADIYANGVLLTDVTNKPKTHVSVYDFNGGAGGALGPDGDDFSKFLAQLFNFAGPPPAPYHQKADLNIFTDSCVERLTGDDFTKFLSGLFNEVGGDAQDNASCP